MRRGAEIPAGFPIRHRGIGPTDELHLEELRAELATERDAVLDAHGRPVMLVVTEGVQLQGGRQPGVNFDEYGVSLRPAMTVRAARRAGRPSRPSHARRTAVSDDTAPGTLVLVRDDLIAYSSWGAPLDRARAARRRLCTRQAQSLS